MALNDAERRILCGIAREALGAAVRGQVYSPPEKSHPALLERCGCFVTLKTGGDLRGCIGCFTSSSPLYRTVADYTAHAALDDPRFAGRRIGAAELPEVRLDISVLSPLQPTDRPEAIVPGVHGIYVSSGGRSGCFLPQVADETGWGVEEFWGHCCRDKAGLEWDAWRRPGVETKIFTAEVFEC